MRTSPWGEVGGRCAFVVRVRGWLKILDHQPRRRAPSPSPFTESAGESRHEEVGEEEVEASTNQVLPREAQSLRAMGRPTGRSVGGRDDGPGD